MEQGRRRVDAVDPLRLIQARQRHTPKLGDGRLFEAMIFVLNVDILSRRRPIAKNSQAGRVQPHVGQPVGARIGQRPEQQRIHNTENGGICPDADGQGKDHHRAESQILAQGAEGVAEVLHPRANHE
jgi:hypothetical protein